MTTCNPSTCYNPCTPYIPSRIYEDIEAPQKKVEFNTTVEIIKEEPELQCKLPWELMLLLLIILFIKYS